MKTIPQKTPIFTLLLLFLTSGLFSQNFSIQKEITQKNLYVIDKVETDQVILRWAPTTPAHWAALNSIGYHIDRLEIPTQQEDFSAEKFERLNSSPILPWPAENWESIVKTDDNAAIGYMTIHAELPDTPSDFFSAMREKDDNERKAYFYGMTAAGQSAQAAEAMGLRFTDKNIQPATRYIYRIYAAAPLDEFVIDTAMLMVNTSNITKTVSPFGLQSISYEKKVVLTWPTTQNRNLFTSYFIEKSDRPNGPFTRLNERPLIQLASEDIPEFNRDFKYVDSLTRNYIPQYYRVVGLTHFGEESPASEIVMGMGKDLTPPGSPRILSAEVNESHQVDLQWEKAVFESDFRGFIVGRSALAEGPYSPLHHEVLPRIVNKFTDENPNPRGSNFYQISAIDTAGNVGRSLMKFVLFQDTFPPEAPTMLRGNIDSSGIVTLDWADNTESDLWGYRVYFANAADHDFIQISSELLKTPHFVDTITLNTLTEEIHYRVVAVDRGFGHSEYSEMVSLKRPDIIAPSAGVFTSYEVRGNQVILQWAPSSSSDAIEQKLQRTSSEGTKTLGVFRMGIDNFIDEDVKNGLQYAYTLEAIDDDGLSSGKSKSLNIRITDARTENPIKNLSIRYNKDKDAMELQWDHDNNNPNQRFVIYRSEQGRGLMSYASVSGETSFVDLDLNAGNKYSYAIMVASAQGRSPLSDQVSAVLPD